MGMALEEKMTFDEFLESLELTEEEYMEAVRAGIVRMTMFFKRRVRHQDQPVPEELLGILEGESRCAANGGSLWHHQVPHKVHHERWKWNVQRHVGTQHDGSEEQRDGSETGHASHWQCILECC